MKLINSYALKWIAIIAMLIDHIGGILFPGIQIFRIIGRLSFPIFSFLIVEGFCYTSNIKRYIARMAMFALISEVPYDWAFKGKILEFGSQNVFFTLLIGLLLLQTIQNTYGLAEKIICLIIAMSIAVIVDGDYDYLGVLLIFWFYMMREEKVIKLMGGALWNFTMRGIQGYGAFAMIPIALYNGEQGPKMQYFFYLFYPVHLLILWGIKTIL